MNDKILIAVTTPSLGDALCTLPAIIEKSKTYDISLWMENRHVRNLLKLCPTEINFAYDKPETFDFEMSIQPVFDKYVRTHHMSQGYYHQLDLSIPTNVPKSPLYILHKFRPIFENLNNPLLVSPFSRSDHNHNKLWFPDRWEKVIHYILEQGRDVILVGSLEEKETETAQAFRNAAKDNKGTGRLIEEYSQPLEYIVGLMNYVGEVLSIDNGMSHLTAALQIKHFLLYPTDLPFCWVSNPNLNAHHIRKRPKDLIVEEVLELIFNSSKL